MMIHFFFKVKSCIKRVLQTIKNIPLSIKQANTNSYFPEKERKTYLQRVRDNLIHTLKYQEVDNFYTLYGLDIKESDKTSFIDYRSFMISRNKCNCVNKINSQIVLLRDKLLFYKYMKLNGFPVPEVFAVLKHGVLYDTDMRVIDKEYLKDEIDYFIKDIDGECASFVKHICSYQDYLKIEDNLNNRGMYIFQRALKQNAHMQLLNSEAINTLRVVTVNQNGEPYVLTSLLRVGTKMTGNVDNWAVGGLAIGVKEDGFLKQFGFYKPMYGQKTERHPDTNILFEEFQIPMYQEVLRLACAAHRIFYNVHSIGWDIAFAEDGPMFIEGNDNWEISLQQACDRGLKFEWLDACKQIIDLQ